MSSALDDRLPRYQRLRDDLAARINRNEWRPGDLIPSEAELGAYYGVAIGTVRKAIDQLVSDGVLERQQGRGTFVRRARFNSSLFRFFRLQTPEGARAIPTSGGETARRRASRRDEQLRLGLAAGAQVAEINRTRLVDGKPRTV
ncbi:MAG: GntR family transcriptional regulator, partial [Bradyrhizobium sp.]